MPDVIDRVRKLLELAKRGSPNEAASAARMARRLIKEHGLTADQIDDGTIDKIELGRIRSTWKMVLWKGLSKLNGCEFGRWTSTRGKKKLSLFRLIGRRLQLRETQRIYKFYARHINVLCGENLFTEFDPVYNKDYRRGCARGVYDKLLEQVTSPEEREAIMINVKPTVEVKDPLQPDPIEDKDAFREGYNDAYELIPMHRKRRQPVKKKTPDKTLQGPPKLLGPIGPTPKKTVKKSQEKGPLRQLWNNLWSSDKSL